MVTKSNAWWMSRTKGIYIFTASPFRQKAFYGFFAELKNIVKLHWSGILYFGALSGGGWYLMKWANKKYHHSLRKDHSYFEAEALQLAKAASHNDADGGEVKEVGVMVKTGKNLGADATE